MENPHAQTSQIKQYNAPSLDLKSKRVQLSSLIRQSFDIFNIYGKDPAAIENIILGFNLALETQAIEDIHYAFTDWMKTESTMPTPADILKISQVRLESRGKRSAPQSANSLAIAPPSKNFPWVGKEYKEALEDGSIKAYFDHWLALDERHRTFAYEWLKYASDFLKYPKGIAEKFASDAGLKKA